MQLTEYLSAEEVFKKIKNNPSRKKKKYYSIEATDFVKTQLDKQLLKLLPKIVKDADAILNLYPEDCPKGMYDFSRIVPLHNEPYNKFASRIVEITPSNAKYLKSEYAARVENELPYLNRWFPKNAPVKGLKSDHVDVILYTKEQLAKEGDTIQADFGIVAVNIEPKNRTPITPATILRNHLGIAFGGNGVKLNKDEYMASVEFWNGHALKER